MKVEMGKKYFSGDAIVRILCVDRPGTDYPVIGMDEDGVILLFKEDGRSEFDESYDLVEIAEPAEGEWCWFWNDRDKALGVHLAKYSKMAFKRFGSLDGQLWDRCIKYNGELPKFLKDITKGDN
jgi:hypothetical protein